ncbi:MAG: DUF1854 domain-containing protein [Isosphaeraceae bacterium]
MTEHNGDRAHLEPEDELHSVQLRTLRLDERRRIVLETTDGACHVGVEPIRAFPFSDPDRFIVFCDADGREILCLDSLAKLDVSTRQLVEEQLALREFQPIIERIVRVSGEGSPSEWQVETDRGPTRFTLDSDDDVRRLGDHRVLIVDARKLRYSIDDIRVLDAQSRRVLERFL